LPALADKSRRISTEGKKQISIVFDGKELKLSPDQEIRFSTTNPKKRGSICFQRYQKYRRATKVAQALKFGCSMSDLKWDISRGHAEIVGKESLVKEVLPKVKKVRVKKAQGEGKARTTRTKRGAADDKGKTAKGANAGKKRDGKKYITKDGLIALNRKFSDPKSWASRRQPQTPPPGGWPTPPAHWPAGVRVDVGKPVYWLPEGWGQGVKTTCAAMLKCYVSPEGKMYYHRHVVEQIVGESLGKPDNPEAAIKWAKSYAQDRIADKTMWDRQPPKVDDPKKLYAQLSKKERSFLPKSADEIYWAVVSARRATDERGLKLIANVQVMLTVAGAKPVWYVDEASVAAYRALGLNAKVGGKLVPARNMALDDAAKAKKPCVQISDDIMHWDYLDGDLEKITGGTFDACNEAARSADRIRLTPVAAASFLLAKLRAARDGQKNGEGPRLGGVFPLGNQGMAFRKEAITTDNFILGDFFVADRSDCRFDPRMTLKEDYDFTCTHLAKHGSVIRCNRLFVAAVHQTNAGGAVSERDNKGDKERQNIKILHEKWPGVFRKHNTRGDTEVIMHWRKRSAGK